MLTRTAARRAQVEEAIRAWVAMTPGCWFTTTLFADGDEVLVATHHGTGAGCQIDLRWTASRPRAVDDILERMAGASEAVIGGGRDSSPSPQAV